MSDVPGAREGVFDGSDYYTGPPLTDAMVAEAERVLGYALPASYVGLLRSKNGGIPKPACFPTAGAHWSDNHVRVSVLFGIGGPWGIDSDEFGSRRLIQRGGFPEVGIIVGWTPTAGHDAIMLDYTECGPRGEPRVSLVDAESGESAVLAPTFAAFLAGLVDCHPYDVQRERELDDFRRRSQGA